MSKSRQPVVISATVLADILAEVAAGTPIRRILRELEISCRTFYGLIDRDAALAERYAHAKAAGLDCLADEILQIADESRIGEKTKSIRIKGTDGVDLPAEEVQTGDMVERAKLQIDARKWLLAKLAPKKYGEFKAVELSGADGGPVRVVTTSDDGTVL